MHWKCLNVDFCEVIGTFTLFDMLICQLIDIVLFEMFAENQQSTKEINQTESNIW